MVKKYRPYILFFYAASVCALIAGAFVDLKLDIWLNDPSDAFSVWLQNTGEMPSRLICPFAGTVLFYTCEKKWQKAAGFLIAIGGSAYFGYYVGKYFFVEQYRMAFSILWGVGFGLFVLLFASKIRLSKDTAAALRTLAVAGIVVMAVQLCAIEGMKYLWGRVRFRDLLAAGSYDAFTPWYQINGINGNKSFPSGHTAGAAMSYLFMLLPYASEKWRKKYVLLFAGPFVYTSAVAFTRLVVGAHYLSDVAMGGIVGFTTVLIAMAVLEKNGQKWYLLPAV